MTANKKIVVCGGNGFLGGVVNLSPQSGPFTNRKQGRASANLPLPVVGMSHPSAARANLTGSLSHRHRMLRHGRDQFRGKKPIYSSH